MATIISHNSDITAFVNGTDSEERLALLSAYFKGVSFEIDVTPEKAHYITEINPTDHITILANRGTGVMIQKEFWIRRMSMWLAIYRKMMAQNERYLGLGYNVLILDMIKEAASSPPDEVIGYQASEFRNKSDDDKCQFWIWGWFLGVGVLKHLGLESDDNNGFQVMEGPKSLMEEFIVKRNEDALKMKKDSSGDDPTGLD